MVYSNAGCLSYGLQLQPVEWSAVDIEAPDVIDWLRACVTTKHKQVRFGEKDGVSIATAGCLTHDGHDHPLGSLFTVPQIQ